MQLYSWYDIYWLAAVRRHQICLTRLAPATFGIFGLGSNPAFSCYSRQPRGSAAQHGQGRGRRHARPPYRAEVLTLDPLPRRSAPARSEHSPTLRERVPLSIAAWRACGGAWGGEGMQLGLSHQALHSNTLLFTVRRSTIAHPQQRRRQAQCLVTRSRKIGPLELRRPLLRSQSDAT